MKGRRAKDWRLVDELVPQSKLAERVAERARQYADASTRKGPEHGVKLGPLERTFNPNGVNYSLVAVEIDRGQRVATITIKGPDADVPGNADADGEGRRCLLATAHGARTG